MVGEKKPDGFDIDRKRFAELLSRLPAGRYDITVEKHGKQGVQQRKYYHAVIVKAFAEYWGIDDDDAHELLKKHCNKKLVETVNKQTGEVEEEWIGASTAGFNTEHWTAFIERCQRWGATEFGFVIPDPDPEWMFKKTA